MDLIFNFIALCVGFGLGCAWYRRTLKTDPGKLDKLAAQIRAAAEKAKFEAEKY